MIDRISKFAADIRALCEERGFEYIDAVIYWCGENEVEVEYAAAMIKQNQNIMSLIEAEANALKLIKKSGAKLEL